MRAGFHITDLSLQELKNFIHNPSRDAAYVRRLLKSDNEWTLTNQLLAGVFDQLALANWQRGGKGKRPKPLPRPGVQTGNTRSFGNSKGRSPAEMRAELARMAGRAPMVSPGDDEATT